jgi:glycosyltransferase involved in cell wall biosynthesis
VRVAAYSDLEYFAQEGRVVTEESFLVFMTELRTSFTSLVVLGRLRDERGVSGAYSVPEGVEFVALPDYPSLSRPLGALRAARGTLRAFRRVLERVDAVWLLGPHPFAIAFAVQALARRRTVVLGVRMDFPAHMRARHPRRPWLAGAAALLDAAWRALARRAPVVAVGGELARRYRSARRVLTIDVSLVRAGQITTPARSHEGHQPGAPFRVLSVGRVDPEKNPLLLADVLAGLVARGVDARLVVCGRGRELDALSERLRELGVADRAELRGFVGGDELAALYRSSDAFLHVSWTEGAPQVLLEAFAAGLPVVATAVGGVAEQAADAALLVAPGRADEAAEALARLAAEAPLRERLAEHGRARVRERTLEAEAGRVARFIAEAAHA